MLYLLGFNFKALIISTKLNNKTTRTTKANKFNALYSRMCYLFLQNLPNNERAKKLPKKTSKQSCYFKSFLLLLLILSNRLKKKVIKYIANKKQQQQHIPQSLFIYLSKNQNPLTDLNNNNNKKLYLINLNSLFRIEQITTINKKEPLPLKTTSKV